MADTFTHAATTPPEPETTRTELHDWVRARGKCVGTMTHVDEGTNDPYYDDKPPRGRYSPQTQARNARSACNGCLAKKACLELALRFEADAGLSWGYWGGTAPAERQAILRDREHRNAPTDGDVSSGQAS